MNVQQNIKKTKQMGKFWCRPPQYVLYHNVRNEECQRDHEMLVGPCVVTVMAQCL